MAIMWFNDSIKDMIATIASSNITLNKVACNQIEGAYNVMLGISADDRKVYIKTINKELALRGDIPKNHLYNITIRSSYARITNKEFIKEISKYMNISFDSPKKYLMTYDTKEGSLIIDLNKEVG